MNNQLLEYIKLHKISLEQDLEELNNDKSLIWDDGSEIEEISLNGQIQALYHILEYAKELDKVPAN